LHVRLLVEEALRERPVNRSKGLVRSTRQMDTEYDPYHPKIFDDMAGKTEWTPLRDLIQSPEPPHLIIAGPTGIGKSLATRFCLKTIALWLRCSQDTSLKAETRERIKSVARCRIQEGRIHWIVLEHADLLHSDAQAFLRRIIETSTGASRFILEVRSLAGVSEPLLSRATLFNAPVLLPYEIRTEIIRRCPLIDKELADALANQSEGSICWAVLQGLGGGEGYIDPSVSLERGTESKWSYILRVMESIQATGTNPKACIGSIGWDRPGGICPWAVVARELALKN